MRFEPDSAFAPIDIELVPPDELSPPEPDRRRHFSYSQLSMYLRCSMQYKFRYVDNLIQRPALALGIGKSGHTAVEYNSQHKLKTGTDRTLEDVLDIFSTSYDAETSVLEPIDMKAGENLGASKDATVGSLTVYHNKLAPRISPLAVEQEFRISIPPTEDDDETVPPIIGRIDSRHLRIEDHPIAIPQSETLDNKFRSRRGHPDEADYSDQLTLYDMVNTYSGKQTAQLGFLTFLPASTRNPPVVEATLRSPHMMERAVREARHQRLISKLRTVAKAIKNGIFVPTDDPKTCSWCGYRDICQGSLVKDEATAARIRQMTGDPP